MAKSTKNVQNAQSSTAQESTNLQSIGKQLVNYVEGTPFAIVESENDFKIVMGQDVVQIGFKTQEEAEAYIAEKPWHLIMTASAIYQEFLKKIAKDEN